MLTGINEYSWLLFFILVLKQKIKFTWATRISASEVIGVELAIQSVSHVPWMGDL